MPNLNIVKPLKLQISAFEKGDFSTPVKISPSSMTVSYNPASLKISQTNSFQSDQGQSTSSAQARFHGSGSMTLSVTLCFNGIDFGRYVASDILSFQQPDVAKDVALFHRLCQQINSETHEISFLRISWHDAGIRSTFEARLQSYTKSYKAVDGDGTPLLAEIDATFVEAVDPIKQQARLGLKSPDLSRQHLVLAGETLPMLCIKYYGSSAAYLQVAAFNQLDSFRSLTPGSQLLFPPLSSAAGSS